jgi:hypothetical protein
MAPQSREQKTQTEIENLFDSMSLTAQKTTALSLRNRFVENTLKQVSEGLFTPVNQNEVLASVLGTNQSAEAPAPYTGKKRGPKPGWKQRKAESSEAVAEDEDKTQALIVAICNAHPEGINIQTIREELTAKPTFDSSSQGDNLTALIRNCLTRAKKKKRVSHRGYGLYGPARKRKEAEAVGV